MLGVYEGSPIWGDAPHGKSWDAGQDRQGRLFLPDRTLPGGLPELTLVPERRYLEFHPGHLHVQMVALGF